MLVSLAFALHPFQAPSLPPRKIAVEPERRLQEEISWSAPEDGRLHVWFEAPGLAPAMAVAVERAGAEVHRATERDSGGIGTPCLVRDLGANDLVLLELSSEAASVPRWIELHWQFVPEAEDPATTDPDDWEQALAAARQGADDARRIYRQILDELARFETARPSARRVDLAAEAVSEGLRSGLWQDPEGCVALVRGSRIVSQWRTKWLPRAHRDRYHARFRMGQVLGYCGRSEEAIEAIEEAFAWLELDPDGDWMLSVDYSVELAYHFAQAQDDESGWHWLESARIPDDWESRSPEERSTLTYWLLNAGRQLKRLERNGSALELLEEYLPALEQAAPEHNLWNLRADLVVLLQIADRDADAVSAARQLLSGLGEYDADGYDDLRLQTLRYLGLALNGLGRNVEAEAILRKAVTDAGGLGFQDQVVSASVDLAYVLTESGRCEQASELLQPFYLSEPGGLAKPGQATLRTALVDALAACGELSRARGITERSLAELVDSSSDPRDVDRYRINLAVYAERQGDVLEAAKQRELALEAKIGLVERTGGDPSSDPDVLLLRVSLSSTRLAQGRYEDALELAEQALALLDPSNPAQRTLWIQAKQRAGISLRELGKSDPDRLALGIKHFEDVLAEFAPEDPYRFDVASSLAWAYESTGRADRALAVLDEARPPAGDTPLALRARLSWHVGRAWSLLSAGGARRNGELDAEVTEALETTKAWVAASMSGAPANQIGAAVQEASGYLATIRSAALEGGLASSSLERLSAAVIALESVPFESGRLARERARQIESEDLVADRRRAGEELAQAILGGGATSDVDRLRAALNEIDAGLALDRGELRALLELDLEELAAELPKDTALVIYESAPRWRLERVGERSSFPEADELEAHVLRRGLPVARVELGETVAIRQAVAAWTRAAQGDQPWTAGAGLLDPYHEHGSALLELAFRPLMKHLEGVAVVLVVPSGPLHGVAFDALPDGDQLLGDEIVFTLLASPRDILRWGDSACAEGGLVAAGGVDYGDPRGGLEGGREPWLPLEHSAIEVETIRALRSTLRVESEPDPVVLTGSAATPEAVVAAAGGARFLHVATHAFFDPARVAIEPAGDHVLPTQVSWSDQHAEALVRNPLLAAGLVLANANTGRDATGVERGILEGSTLASLDLTACEVAVLSACTTARSLESPYGGVAGLRTALSASGVRSSVTVLWSVGDESAQTLMTAFYHHLWQDGVPVAEALWWARRELADAGRSPRTWAGWVLSGDHGIPLSVDEAVPVRAAAPSDE